MSEVREAVRAGVERFARALEAKGGNTLITGSHAEATERVRALVGGRPAVVDADPILEAVAGGLVTVKDPWQAEVGVTSAFLAVEETATLGLLADADRPRSTSLVPPVHVAMLPTARLVATYADGVARVAELRPVPSGVQFITGPSSSGDIELTMVRGVHGPGEVHVVFFPGDGH